MSDGKMGRSISLYGEPLIYRELTSSDDCGEMCSAVEIDRENGVTALFVNDTDSLEEILLDRAVCCINACAGMDDPAKEIARLRQAVAECRAALGWLQPDREHEALCRLWGKTTAMLDGLLNAE